MNNRSENTVFFTPINTAIVSLILSAYAIFYRLGAMPLLAPDEGRNAEIAREMAVSGNWLVPLYNGITYLDKPAFYFKSVAIAFNLFGVSEASARLSSALFAAGLIIMVYAFCRRVYNANTAATAAIVVASMPLFMAFSRIVIFDMTLAFFVSAAILASFLAETDPVSRQKFWYCIAAAAAGMATIIKGPVGFILPTLVIFSFHWTEGRKGVAKRYFSLSNWMIFLAIFLPWFIGLSWICNDFPYYGIVKESLARFTTQEFHRTAPFYYYAIIIFGGCFASCLLLPEAVIMAWQHRKRLESADRLFIVWALTVVLFFSISQSKLPGYILTAVVALGILFARIWTRALTENHLHCKTIVRHAGFYLFVIATLLGIAAIGLMYQSDMAFSLKMMRPEVVADLQPFLPDFMISMLTIAVLSLVSALRNCPKQLFISFLAVPLLLLTINFPLFIVHANHKSGKSLATQVAALVPDNTPLACIQCYPNGLSFYLQRQITVLSTDGGEFTSNYIPFYLKQHSQWPTTLVSPDKFNEWFMSQPRPFYVIGTQAYLPVLQSLAEKNSGRVLPLEQAYWILELPLIGN